jgi:long-chain acyl-CoA synthetase
VDPTEADATERPWLASYPPDVPRNLEPFPGGSLFGLLERSAERFGDHTASAFFGAHLSYRDLRSGAERFSAMLANLGVGKGDRVALILPNCPQYLIAYYGTVRIGAVVVGNNPLYTPDELAHQLSDCDPAVTIVLDLFHDLLSRAVRRGARTGEVLVTRLNEYMPFPLKQLARIEFRRQAKAQGHPWPPIPRGVKVRHLAAEMRTAGAAGPAAVVDAEHDTAALLYTGGTTGPSKGAMLSHHALTANAMQGASWFAGIVEGEEVMMCALPFFHAFGMLAMNAAVLMAAKLALVPRFDLDLVLKAIEKERPTLFPGVPRMYIALNESPKTAGHDLRSITACISGAAPLPQAVADRFREVTGGGELVEGYGLTEASPVTHANPFQGRRKPGSIGLPMPNTDCKIVNLEDADRIQPPGEPGELCVRGPQLMLGYWGRPEETANVLRNGWLHTGDIAVMDERGYFTIVDRLKDLVIVSGFNVYPNEIEDVLYHHPKVQKCAVIGVPDERTGERVKAFIVLRPGETATPEEIIAWCRDPDGGSLARYRVPREIEFRDELPETLIGKVLRRVLQTEERARRDATLPAGAADAPSP